MGRIDDLDHSISLLFSKDVWTYFSIFIKKNITPNKLKFSLLCHCVIFCQFLPDNVNALYLTYILVETLGCMPHTANILSLEGSF